MPTEIGSQQHKEIVGWCEERFGPSREAPGGRWCGEKCVSKWFRDEHDAMEFRLRWC
jgi:hypothetical protein